MSVRRLRVAHVVPAADFVRHILIHDLRRMRDRVDSIVICSPGAALDDIRAEGFTVLEIPIARKIAPGTDVVSLARLVRALRAARVDLVHSYTPKGGLLGQLAARLAGVRRRIHSCRGLLYTPGMSPSLRRLLRATDRVTFAAADRSLFLSGADLAHVVETGLCAHDRATLTGSGIDLTAFDPAALPAGTREAVRAELGIPPDAPLVLTVGRYVADKGYRELADAAARVLATHPDVHFVWIAPAMDGEAGVLPDALHAEPPLRGRVHRLPLRHDVARFYVAADLLAHPSHREGVPRVVMEAAAMGLPIVASDIPGCREVVRDGETARLVPVGDAAAWAAALRDALDDPAGTAARAAAARADVRARFDQDALTRRILAAYDSVLAGRE
ncbi:glycosyltransferase [Roseisolibacter agri]|uniref:glycosyltransferase n=1 Tax=Roseisolibacter agri TaxID=2014610 RepID=UPI0024E10137|nr:glycosyltransferase [Roseisolibacter agri]